MRYSLVAFCALLLAIGCQTTEKVEISIPLLPYLVEAEGVHFHAGGYHITALHIYDPEPFRRGGLDIWAKISDKPGYKVVDKYSLKFMDSIYMLLPDGGKVYGRVWEDAHHKSYFYADFETRVRPGYSGTPVFDSKTNKVVGLITGHTRLNVNGQLVGYGATVICKVTKDSLFIMSQIQNGNKPKPRK